MTKHTREKPFKCNQCNYAGTNSGNLQRHMRTHSGERPFKCNQCSKAYKDKRDFTKHCKGHSTYIWFSFTVTQSNATDVMNIKRKQDLAR